MNTSEEPWQIAMAEHGQIQEARKGISAEIKRLVAALQKKHPAHTKLISEELTGQSQNIMRSLEQARIAGRGKTP